MSPSSSSSSAPPPLYGASWVSVSLPTFTTGFAVVVASLMPTVRWSSVSFLGGASEALADALADALPEFPRVVVVFA